MNTKLSILLTAIAGTAISAMPAQAFSFGTGGISFAQDTTLEFEVIQTYGRYRTDLRLYEVVNGNIAADLGILFGEVRAADEMVWDEADQRYEPTSDPLGTAGNAVIGSPTTFTFEAGKEYSLGIVNYHFSQPNDLEDPNKARSIFYSTNALNDDGVQRAVFGSMGGGEIASIDNAAEYTEGNPFGGYVNISFDDAGNNDDLDYQDFTFKAMVIESTPEPATLAGLGIVAGGMFLSRFRKKQK